MMAHVGDLPIYKHEKLSHRDSMRLLKLWHGDERTEEVVCDLFEVAPKHKNRYIYEALSWTWGTKGPKTSIKIDKKVDGEDEAFAFVVSCNLYLALKALRNKEKSRVLWVDAICINQDIHQLNERNHHDTNDASNLRKCKAGLCLAWSCQQRSRPSYRLHRNDHEKYLDAR